MIDDVHLIRDRGDATEVERLILESDPGVRTILIGRHLGALSVGRLALATDVAEIGGQELEFNLDESGELLALTTGMPVDAESLEPLIEETRGWAVALRLVATQIRQNFSPRGIRDDVDTPGGAVWEYIESQVLDQLPQTNVDLLVQTSIVPQVTAELAEAVTGRPDARGILDSHVMHHDFVEPGATDGTYVFHPVLRAHLNRRLARRGQHATSEAHLRAAEWLSRNGHDDEAMHHFVRANSEDLALSLGVAHTIRHLITGRLPGQDLLLPGEIPAWYFASDPVRMYGLCASLLCASNLSDAAEWLGRLEFSLVDGADDYRNRARVEFLWAIHDSEACDSEGVIAHFERGARYLQQAVPDEDGSGGPAWLQPLDHAVQALLPWLVAKAQADVGRPEDAAGMLDQHRHSDQQPVGSLALGSFASLALSDGRLGEALGLAHRAIETAKEGPDSAVLRVESHIVLAGVMLEQDQVACAREELSKARGLAQSSGLHHYQLMVDCEAARISLSEGNPASALRQIHAIRESALTEPIPSAVALKMGHIELRARLALGEADHARSILAQVPQLARRPDSSIRIHLCAGRPDRAATELERAPSPSGIRDRIEMMLLRARVNLQLGNPRGAEHVLDEALDLGRTGHFVRVFLEEPSQVLDALRSLGVNRADSYLADVLASGSTQKPSKPLAQVAMLEPLTERERELLNFLPSHLSQYEIAREMYISANTVKTHIKGLYRKLGATSRSEAVELAKSCGLL